MVNARTAIYVRGHSQEDVSVQITNLKIRIRNDGSVFSGKNLTFADIGTSTVGLKSLMTAVEGHKLDVLYLGYTFTLEMERNEIRLALNRIYICGISAIVVP